MTHSKPYLYKHILSDSDRDALVNYFSIDDDKTDQRPDVRSKHPDWADTNWPKEIVANCLEKIFPTGYYVEDISFREDKIGLKPHTDFGSLPGTVGKTVLILLDAIPVAHTIFFDHYWPDSDYLGAFFTKSNWSPYTYKLENVSGQLVEVADIRVLLEQCKNDPESITEFKVDQEFIKNLERLIHIRSLPVLDKSQKNQTTGYTQPAPRKSDYNILTNYSVNKEFDADFHKHYLYDVALEDLHGLEVSDVLTWENNAAIVFDRQQLHSSSSCHDSKMFITIFCHGLES